MALTFPPSPSNGEHFIAENGILYVYDGVKWIGSGSTSAPTLNLGNIYFTDQTISGNDHTANINVNGNLVADHLTSNTSIMLNGTELTTVDNSLFVNGVGISTTADFSFDNGVMHLPLTDAKLNAGGVGVTNSAEFGTQVSGDMGGITHSEIYMGAGTAESRAIVDDQGRSLMYLGTENVGDGKFGGIVARDPNVDSQYSPGLNESNLPTIGIQGDTYAAAVGVLNPQGLINGLYADETQTIITGETNIIINNNGSHPWIFDTVGDLISSGMLRNQYGHRAVYENEIARDVSDLTDNYMLLNQSAALDNINIDGGGALATYTTSITFADGGYSGSRWGSASTVYDGGLGAAGAGYTTTLNGGGA